MKARLLSILCALLMSLGIQAQNAEFETAAEAVKNMKVGWNLWNTLESHGGLNSIYDPANYHSLETGWGHPKTKPELMKMLRKAGFNAIRVPVTWFPYMDADGIVDSRWMKRVHEVVDYVIDQGMYCMLNVHHDTGDGDHCWIKADETNYNKNHKRFENLWRQIAEEFKDYDEHLLFEGYNEMVDLWSSWWPHPYSFSEWSETKPGVWEPTGHDEAIELSVYNAVNNYAQSFVNAVRSTGGNNKTRNLVVNTYAASCAASSESGKDYPLANLKIPDDETQDHIAIQIHYYPDLSIKGDAEKETEQNLSKWNEHIKTLHAPLIIGEWDMKEGTEEGLSYSIYLLKNTAPYDIATFVFGGTPSYNDRSFPAFKYPEHVRAMLKGYYGEDYEPTLLTEDNYDFHVKVSYDYDYAELMMYDEGELHQYLDLNEYKGIRVELESIDGIAVKAYGETYDQEQYFSMSSPEETFYFDKSELGSKVRTITLQNWKEGKNETKLLHAYLIKEDGTEESIDINQYRNYHDTDFEIISQRKQFVHTVEYNYQWAELNIFYDDIPLKLKNYKGIRLELAEMSKDVHVKFYGDGEQKEDYIEIADASSTILFNTDIFSNEINRVTLQYTKDGKGEVKVISAWLIRQDGTEEYSDLSSFHDSEITKVEKYVPEQPITIIAKDLTMTYGDEVPELVYTTEGGDLNGTPQLSTTVTKTSPVGTYPIKVERGTVANTQVTFVDGTMTITQAPLTVGVQDVTIYEGDVIPTFTLTYDGWRNKDTEGTAFTKKPTAKTIATNKSKAGTYTITVSGGEAKNYKLSYQNGTLTIKEKGSTSPWTSLVLNGDLESNDMSCFYMRENAAKNDKILPATIVDGVGKYNTRGIVIHSTNNPPENWNTQFFVQLTQPLSVGTRYRLSLDGKAIHEAYVSMESHAEPGDYIWWDFGNMTLTTSWQNFEFEGTITKEQSTDEKKMRTIAFNLANVATATTYYFDNIDFEIYLTTDIRSLSADSQGDNFIYNLSGQRLSKPLKGINIINGKKVFRK